MSKDCIHILCLSCRRKSKFLEWDRDLRFSWFWGGRMGHHSRSIDEAKEGRGRPPKSVRRSFRIGPRGRAKPAVVRRSQKSVAVFFFFSPSSVFFFSLVALILYFNRIFCTRVTHLLTCSTQKSTYNGSTTNEPDGNKKAVHLKSHSQSIVEI